MQEIQRQTRLTRQEEIRLNKLVDTINFSDNSSISLEGEPLYADRDWNELHTFSYGLLLPNLLTLLAQKNASTTTSLDILYDELTVQHNRLSLNTFLTSIFLASERLAEFKNSKKLRIFNESEFLDRGQAFIKESVANGLTIKVRGVHELHLKNQAPIPITTQSGRPACVVLDAIYQSCKAQAGTDIAFVNHNVNFSKQQEQMMQILKLMNNSFVPFSNYINIFFRERNNNITLGSIRNYKKDGSILEVG